MYIENLSVYLSFEDLKEEKQDAIIQELHAAIISEEGKRELMTRADELGLDVDDYLEELVTARIGEVF